MEDDRYLETLTAPNATEAGTTAPATKPDAAKRVATEIRGLMAARKYNAVDLAPVLGISTTTATRRVNGDTDISVNEVEAIAAWLDVPITRIIAPAAGTGFSQ